MQTENIRKNQTSSIHIQFIRVVFSISFLFCSGTLHSLFSSEAEAKGRTLRIFLDSKPSHLQRGRMFFWKGRVQGASRKQLKKGLMLSMRLIEKGQSIFSIQTPVFKTGSFVLRGRVPFNLKHTKVRIQLSLWKRKTKRLGFQKRKKKKENGKTSNSFHKMPKKNDQKQNLSPNSKYPSKQTRFFTSLKKTKDKKDKKEKLSKPHLWKQLKQGWGPGKTKKAENQRQKVEQLRKKNHFVLPPVSFLQKKTNSKNQIRHATGQSSPPKHSTEYPKKSILSQKNRRELFKHNQEVRKRKEQIRRGNQQSGQQEKRNNRERDSRFGTGSKNNRSQRGRISASQGQQKRTEQPGSPTMMPSSNRKPSRHQRRRPSSPPGSGADRRLWSQSVQTNLDLNTKGGHTYLRQVFEPYLPEHQRITVFNKIGQNYHLYLSSVRKFSIKVGGRRSVRRSYFVGRIHVVLFPGRWTAIPSAAPDARILWYRTMPKVNLLFAKDKGDVVFVRTRSTEIHRVSLVFGTDADKKYFGGKIPRGIRARHYPVAKRPLVDPKVRRTVSRYLYRSGIHRSMTLRKMLEQIVPFLRSFIARPLSRNEQHSDPYITLTKARAGVCRHRAMIFTVTMQTLGFPARFVSNNAHAFAEIQFPNGRWRQIDLGGGDVPHYMGSWKGESYKPPKDPFPKPPPSRITQRRTDNRKLDSREKRFGKRGLFKGPKLSSPNRKGQVSRIIVPKKRRKKKKNYVSHTRIQ